MSGMRQDTGLRKLRYEASSAEALRRKVPRLTLLPGSTGRIELISRRVFGVCPVPLGPLMRDPDVGKRWADHLLTAGAHQTRRGGFGGLGPRDCDAYVEWEVRAGQGQGQGVSMGLGPVLLIALAGAAVLVLLALAWAISKIILLVEAVVKALGPLAPLAITGVIILGVIAYFSGRRR